MTPEQQATMARGWIEPYRLSSNGVNGTHDAIGNLAGTAQAVSAVPLVGGEAREVSIVMADLRGFTTFCEQTTLDRMSRVLNEYLTAMVDVILGQHGRVQDFVGDGILGVFGAPLPDPDHAWHATLAALEMQRAIRQLAEHWAREDAVTFGLGVAVHSGRVFAGSVGCPKQRKYAVVGDPVNTVARLEELNRALGTQIVMSGDSLALVSGRVDVHPRGSYTMRGRSHSVDVFELLGVRDGRDYTAEIRASQANATDEGESR